MDVDGVVLDAAGGIASIFYYDNIIANNIPESLKSLDSIKNFTALR